MAEHVRTVHDGVWNRENPIEDWLFEVGDSFKKPLARQVDEFRRIRMAKGEGVAVLGGKMTNVSKEIYNSKDEWYSHSTQWDSVG